MSKTAVLIVEDQEIVRQGLRAILESDPDIVVVGEAADGAEGIEKAEQTKPDVVVMDIRMQGMDGRVAARKIRDRFPEMKVVILSSYDEDDLVREMVFAGASAYLVKQSCGQDLIQAIHGAKKGQSLFSRCIMDRFRHARKREEITGRKDTGLTAREREVLMLIAEGYSNLQIAAELGISVKTVEKHRQAVINKLDIHDIAGLTRYVLNKQMLPTAATVESADAHGSKAPMHPSER